MVVQVLHKPLQLRFPRLAMPSLLGSGLPERLRSTLIALFGLTAAAGLSMVAFVLQQGFPLVASGPIPDPAVVRESVDERVAVSPGTPPREEVAPTRSSLPADAPAASGGGTPVVASPAPAPPQADPGSVAGPAPSGARKAPKRPPVPPQPQAPLAQVPATAPPVEPDATSSELPPPVSEPEPEGSSHPGKGNAYGKGNGVGSGGTPPGQLATPPGHANGQNRSGG
jgi:hypothetical protein